MNSIHLFNEMSSSRVFSSKPKSSPNYVYFVVDSTVPFIGLPDETFSLWLVTSRKPLPVHVIMPYNVKSMLVKEIHEICSLRKLLIDYLKL